MPILKLLSDDKNAKSKVILSLELKKAVNLATKAIAGKLGMKPTIDLWTVKDQKKATGAADSRKIELDTKLDPKTSFDKQGVSAEHYVYAKKKGDPPNDPAALAEKEKEKEKAKEKEAEQEKEKEKAKEEAANEKAKEEAEKEKAKEKEKEKETPPPPPPPAPTPAAPPPPAPEPKAAPPPPPPPSAAEPPAPASPGAPPAPPPKLEGAAPASSSDKPQPPSPGGKAAVVAVAREEPKPAGKAAGPAAGAWGKVNLDAGGPTPGGQGSAVEAFMQELREIGGGRPVQEQSGTPQVLGALLSELSMKPDRERSELRSLGTRRSTSPIGRWAAANAENPAAKGMLEVAGLIECVEQGRPGPASSSRQPPDDFGGGGSSTFRPVRDLLYRIQLEKYEDVFRDADFDFNTLLSVSEDELRQIGVSALGARKRILAEVERVKAAGRNPMDFGDEGMTRDDWGGVHHSRASPRDRQGMGYGGGDPRQVMGGDDRSYATLQAQNTRVMRREKELERRWEEISIMDTISGGADAWEQRWQVARRIDAQQLNLWRLRARSDGRHASPPPATRQPLLLQRLAEMRSAEASFPTPSPQQRPSPRLPANWQVFYTAQGVPYYYNTAARTTQWTFPHRSTSPSRSPRSQSPRGGSQRRSSPYRRTAGSYY